MKKPKQEKYNEIKVPNLHGMDFAEVIKKMANTKPITNDEIIKKSKESRNTGDSK